MPKPYDYAKVEIDIEPGTETDVLTPESDTPFRILVIADFSSRASRGLPPHRPKPIFVDRDNFDHVMARVAPSLALKSPDGRDVAISFRELDDFHPDRLFERLEVFRSLRQLRDQLLDPATFAETAGELQPPSARAAKAPDVRDLASASLLDEMIESTEQRPSSKARRTDPVREYVRQIVAPHIVPKAHPQQGEMISQVDAATSSEMRALLHHPDFQALEAAWRGLFFLVRNVETTPLLKIFILDLSTRELSSGVVDQLIDAAGDEPWSLIVSAATFGEHGLNVLAHMGKLARKAGAAFLAAADPAVLGTDPWEALRSTPQASYIGLAMPRILLRLPYGKEQLATEQFDFDEMPEPKHDAYLWGNPAFACAMLIAESFTYSGWEMRPGQYQEITGLPIHTYTEDGESKMKPCAEIWLTQRDVDLLLEQGIMPLVSIKNSDNVRVGRIQSIRRGAVPLSGRWG